MLAGSRTLDNEPPAGRPRGREDRMKQLLRNLWQDESGQDLAEYAMLVVLIAVALIVIVGLFATAVEGGFQQAIDGLFG
jgi:Flp pilus assembly pilin Flp